MIPVLVVSKILPLRRHVLIRSLGLRFVRYAIAENNQDYRDCGAYLPARAWTIHERRRSRITVHVRPMSRCCKADVQEGSSIEGRSSIKASADLGQVEV